MLRIFIIMTFIFYSAYLFASPKLSIEPSEYNFGFIESGRSIEGGFTVSNAGNTVLNLSITPDEGLVLTNDKAYSLEKNRSVVIGFTVKIEKSFDGVLSRHIAVKSNDKDTPDIILTVIGIINNPAAGPHKDYDRRINYLTNLDMSTLESNNIATIMNNIHCESCIPVINKLLGWIIGRDSGIIINYYNLEINENKESADKFVKKMGFYPDLPILVYKGKNYFGKDAIIKLTEGNDSGSGMNNLNKGISVIAVFSAGLLDGINPCAFTVIILLISYLTLQLKSARSILLSGIIYIFSVFLTYFLIGLGLFQFVKTISFYPAVSITIKYILIAVLAVLAVLSFFDFIKARQGKNNEMILKLPDFFQKAVRHNIRMQMKDYSIFLSSLLLGFIVSLFTLVCTGQVYLPVIGYMVQNSDERFPGLIYLLIYNIAFIIPLVLIFILVYFGVSSKKIGEALAGNVPAIKLAFVFLFLIFGVITALTLI